MVFYTRFKREYQGENALREVHDSFVDVELELKNIAHPVRVEYFDDQGRAKAEFILPDKTPISWVSLYATKFFGGKSGYIILEVRHFKGEKAKFPQLEEIISHYQLRSEGTDEHISERR